MSHHSLYFRPASNTALPTPVCKLPNPSRIRTREDPVSFQFVIALALLLLTTVTRAQPILTVSPAGAAETEGGAVSLRVVASGATPLTYQWSRQGALLAGATTPMLVFAPLRATDAGSYTVTVTDRAGATTSVPVVVTVLPAPIPIVDAQFRADPTLDGFPTALLALPGGSVLLASGRRELSSTTDRLLRLLPDGRIDPAFREGVAGKPTNNSSAILALALQGDGKLLVGGEFTSYAGQSRPRLVRLNPDGSLDPSFTPAASATANPVRAIVVQPDGRILLANSGPVPVRLLADGSPDTSFVPAPVAHPNPPNTYYVFGVALAASGKILVHRDSGISIPKLDSPGPTSDTARIDRINSDGTNDGGFTPIRSLAGVTRMHSLPDGQVMVSGFVGFTPIPTGGVVRQQDPTPLLRRYRSDGSHDTSYVPNAGVSGLSNVAFFYENGAALALGGYRETGGAQVFRPIVRLDANGALDLSFHSGTGSSLLTHVQVSNDGKVLIAGPFDVFNGVFTPRVARLNNVPGEATNAPVVLALTADNSTVKAGEPLTLRAAVNGSGSLSYHWSGPSTFTTTAGPTFTFTPNSVDFQGLYSLRVENTRGEARSLPLAITVLPADPVILQQPTRISGQSGRILTLNIAVNPASSLLVANWFRDGVPEATFNPNVSIGLSFEVRPTRAGVYTVTLRNTAGVSVTSAPILVTVDDSSRFANLSTRAFVGPGEQATIAGFVIAPGARRLLIIRGLGPALGRFGVEGALSDPRFSVFDGSGRVVAANDNWENPDNVRLQADSAAFARVGAFPLDRGSRDAAVRVDLPPGEYTVQLSNASGQTGIGLVEIYEDDNRAERIVNLSSRVLVTSAAVAIPGISIQGPVSKKVLVRAIGPALTGFGVTGALANPRLDLKNNAGTSVAVNDDWETSANAAEIRSAAVSVGAFALPPGSRDAAVLVTLAPGNYTALVEGAAGTSGVALVELYEVPQAALSVR